MREKENKEGLLLLLLLFSLSAGGFIFIEKTQRGLFKTFNERRTTKKKLFYSSIFNKIHYPLFESHINVRDASEEQGDFCHVSKPH